MSHLGRASRLLQASAGRVGFVDELITDLATGVLESGSKEALEKKIERARKQLSLGQNEAKAAGNMVTEAIKELADAGRHLEAQLEELKKPTE